MPDVPTGPALQPGHGDRPLIVEGSPDAAAAQGVAEILGRRVRVLGERHRQIAQGFEAKGCQRLRFVGAERSDGERDRGGFHARSRPAAAAVVKVAAAPSRRAVSAMRAASALRPLRA